MSTNWPYIFISLGASIYTTFTVRVLDINIFTTCQPRNAWDIEIEELLTFFDDFSIIGSKQFHEKRLIAQPRDDKSDLVRGHARLQTIK